ncbi:MAG TPA: 30S ribosome-binding factor RbfA [bacterium]|jgi:ribosome-binding factor A
MRRPDAPNGKKRPLRIAAEILRDLPEILRAQVDLPDGVMVSITDVEVNDDLTTAKIFFSVFGGDETRTGPYVQKLLNARKGAVRHEIAQRLVMRQHPEVRFIYDETPARAAHIEELLKKAREIQSPEDGGENA